MHILSPVILAATAAAAAAVDTTHPSIQRGNYFHVTDFSAYHIPHSTDSSLSFHWSDPAINMPETNVSKTKPSSGSNNLATFTYEQSMENFEFLKDGKGGYILGLFADVSHGYMNGTHHFPASDVEKVESPPGSGFVYQKIKGPKDFLVPWKGYQ